MDPYTLVKTLHVVSATVLFGTGLGIAFFLWRAHRGGEPRVVAAVARDVVLADAVFTLPSVVVQPASGLWLAHAAGLPLDATWLLASMVLYLVAAACWLPVVWLQWRIRALAAAAARDGTPLPASYRRCMRWWLALGWPAFVAVLGILWLMVAKPA